MRSSSPCFCFAATWPRVPWQSQLTPVLQCGRLPATRRGAINRGRTACTTITRRRARIRASLVLSPHQSPGATSPTSSLGVPRRPEGESLGGSIPCHPRCRHVHRPVPPPRHPAGAGLGFHHHRRQPAAPHTTGSPQHPHVAGRLGAGRCRPPHHAASGCKPRRMETLGATVAVVPALGNRLLVCHRSSHPAQAAGRATGASPARAAGKARLDLHDLAPGGRALAACALPGDDSHGRGPGRGLVRSGSSGRRRGIGHKSVRHGLGYPPDTAILRARPVHPRVWPDILRDAPALGYCGIAD